MSTPTLAGTGITVVHPARRRGASALSALRDVDVQVAAGETVGLVGASGSGKSTLVRVLLALQRPDAGRVTWAGRPVAPAPVARLRELRRAVQWVPQDPAASLDPRMSVEQLLTDPLRRLRVPGDRDAHRRRVLEALDAVHLDPALLGRRPAQLSGGQAQRVALARALATGSRVLLADEPVSGLDLPLRDQVLEVLAELAAVRGLGVLLVSHDLTAVARLCRRTVVLHQGRVVEHGATAALLADPRHAATRELVAAVPTLA